MTKLFGKTFAAILTVLGSTLILDNTSLAEDLQIGEQPSASPAPMTLELPDDNSLGVSDLENSLDSELSTENSPMEQVTSVSQLRDVQPTDWAFVALQSLVERYGCIEGYPDRTFRGNRAMTRYEFAAGLNACLERITEVIGVKPSPDSGITQEDLERIRRLQQDFASELANLRGRVDSLEARTTTLEQQQFSTTTKLSGQVITYLGDAFGENADPANNATFNYQASINLITSFSGRDTLFLSLEASNLTPFDTATQFPVGPLSGFTNEARLAIPSKDVYGYDNNEIALSMLQYSFPIGDRVTVFLDAFSSNRMLTGAVSQLNNFGTGPLSYYGKVNPLIYPVGTQTGIGLKWQATSWLSFDLSAASEIGSNNPGLGLFDKGYAASIRPVIDLGRFKFTGYYVHSYSPQFGIDTFAGSNSARIVGAGPVVGNTYIAAAFYRLFPNFEIGGSFGYSTAIALGEGTKGNAHVWDYDINFTLYDLGKKGNYGGLIIGMQPRLTGTSNSALAEAIGLPPGQRKDRDMGLHIEAFYTHRITDNIAITPGVFWLTAPNHDARNPDVIVGVIRTSLSF